MLGELPDGLRGLPLGFLGLENDFVVGGVTAGLDDMRR